LIQIFQDPFYDEFGTWPLAYIPYGGADFGEVVAVAEAAAEATDEAFYRSWTAFAARLGEEAEAELKKGHRVGARDLFLRASVFYSTSYHPLYGDPVNPLLLEAFRNQVLTYSIHEIFPGCGVFDLLRVTPFGLQTNPLSEGEPTGGFVVSGWPNGTIQTSRRLCNALPSESARIASRHSQATGISRFAARFGCHHPGLTGKGGRVPWGR
jgi:hypothetical protein